MGRTRGLTPTEAGQDFYERARKIIDEARDADIAVSGAAGGLTGRLRASAGVTISRLHIVPRLHVFLDQHPNLALDLGLSDRTGDLIQEGVDMWYRTGVLSDSSGIARKIATSRRLVVGTPAFFEQSGVPKTPTDLSRHAAVIYTMERAGGGDTYTFRQGASDIAVTLSGRLRVNAAEAVLAPVLRCLASAIPSELMIAADRSSVSVRPALPHLVLLQL